MSMMPAAIQVQCLAMMARSLATKHNTQSGAPRGTLAAMAPPMPFWQPPGCVLAFLLVRLFRLFRLFWLFWLL